MLDLIAVWLLAADSVMALVLLHIEVNDPRRRLERMQARRDALRRREDAAKKAATSGQSRQIDT
jgi:heme exporter protein D